eukprot:CAMPEP_0173399078 /NCGR_PEP_ID=MMETSP1356-20130122/43888_1 /TAXON_ID=77927 ORGANISM="Hemiselmis virescens, Strain PCC157" /NCGR_SAMPLE_ID=MMETSP1356 /ASSEMBLY_ACC=CAM_ASM_000847 /LENGTH=37 /DNA_ID= /DNA_START= /DNA_END= /DNA_ORIENTATION=
MPSPKMMANLRFCRSDSACSGCAAALLNASAIRSISP